MNTRTATRGTALSITVVGVLLSLLVSAPAQAEEPAPAAPVLDGSSESTAAASCWEIKQNKPSATDGQYWLLTPQLVRPRQFYCDMTTDGGGWVLVGRGREGWKDSNDATGSAEQLAAKVTGPEAFSVRQLSGKTIDALLGGKRVDSMTDGIRVRRALNTAGTAWQEVSWTYKSRDRWAWGLGAGHPIASGKVGSFSFTGQTTRVFGQGGGENLVFTWDYDGNNYVRGFNYDYNVVGNTDPSSYLYSSEQGGHWATPFAQVYIRPKITQADLTFPTVPDSGLASQTAAPIPQSGSLPTSWGVTGTGAAGTGENANEVQAFAQIGSTMYVGGNFTTVQKGANASGADKISQPYLAAFDATTGDYLSSFKPPALNNQVKSLAALPGGKLAVGGEFTTVAGASRAGLVVLDGSTGAVDSNWTTSIVNKISGGTVSIRGLDVSGDYLYVAGALSHFKVGSTETYAKGAGRIKISTRVPDKNWNPELNGTATAIDVSDDDQMVYLSGYFTKSRNDDVLRGGAFGTASGAPLKPWNVVFSTAGSARYQQAVKQVGDRVWLGGSQHSMFGYDRSTLTLNKAHVTKWGGDIQAIEKGNGLVFAGCHCENWNYSDTTDFDGMNPGVENVSWSQGDKIYYIGAYDAGTGDYVPEFAPEMRARNGNGVWAIKVASDGTVWAGGSLQSGVATNGTNQWLGSFARFAPRPSTAPNKPGGGSASLVGTDATVTWGASSSSNVTYEVLRNDRVVATTTGTSAKIPGSTGTDRFFVRATSDNGTNRSATTDKITPAVTTTLLAEKSTWSWLFDDTVSVPTTWQQPEFDASSWKTGAAPLGFGSTGVATNIDVPSGTRRAVVSYYRSTFQIAPGSTYGTVTLRTRADDGVAAYVNGVEVGRSNLPSGTVSGSTYASSAPTTSQATGSPVSFEVPVSVLRTGTNTVALSVHSMYRSTPDSSVDASVSATQGSNAVSTPVVTTTFVPEKATWSYLFSRSTAAPNTWKTSATGTEAWRTGAAPLGWGNGSIATNIDVPSGETRGITSYHRRTFDVTDPSAIKQLTLTTRADDGIAVYVNGVEVTRSNLPSGTLTSSTYATSAVQTSTALANQLKIDVPPSVLVSGTNTIAVEVHSNYRATPNTSMDLSLVGRS